jgi:hypothetical protein
VDQRWTIVGNSKLPQQQQTTNRREGCALAHSDEQGTWYIRSELTWCPDQQNAHSMLGTTPLIDQKRLTPRCSSAAVRSSECQRRAVLRMCSTARLSSGISGCRQLAAASASPPAASPSSIQGIPARHQRIVRRLSARAARFLH